MRTLEVGAAVLHEGLGAGSAQLPDQLVDQLFQDAVSREPGQGQVNRLAVLIHSLMDRPSRSLASSPDELVDHPLFLGIHVAQGQAGRFALQQQAHRKGVGYLPWDQWQPPDSRRAGCSGGCLRCDRAIRASRTGARLTRNCSASRASVRNSSGLMPPVMTCSISRSRSSP